MDLGGHVVMQEHESKQKYSTVVAKSTQEKCGRTTKRWLDNIKELRKDWFRITQDRNNCKTQGDIYIYLGVDTERLLKK